LGAPRAGKAARRDDGGQEGQRRLGKCRSGQKCSEKDMALHHIMVAPWRYALHAAFTLSRWNCSSSSSACSTRRRRNSERNRKCYSYLSATIGSTFDALCAGRNPANADTPIRQPRLRRSPIARTDPEQPARDQPRRSERDRNSNGDPDRDQRHTLPEHHAQNIDASRSLAQPHAESAAAGRRNFMKKCTNRSVVVEVPVAFSTLPSPL
jgi:hypothetical protein